MYRMRASAAEALSATVGLWGMHSGQQWQEKKQKERQLQQADQTESVCSMHVL